MASDKIPSVLDRRGSLAMDGHSPTSAHGQDRSGTHADRGPEAREVRAHANLINLSALDKIAADKENKSLVSAAYEDSAAADGADESRVSHPRDAGGSSAHGVSP